MTAKITAEEFVRAWMKAHAAGKNVGDVAKSIGWPRAATSTKANYLRHRGIALPKLIHAPRTSKYTPEVVAKLNALCGKK